MKIAFVSDVVYPYVKGGAEKRFYEFARRLSRDHEVHVYGIKWWEGSSVLVRDGITYHGVCRPRTLYSAEGRRSISEALAFGLALLGPLLKEKFDVIDCNQHPYFSIFTCKLASLLRGGRFYVTWHEVWGDYWYEYMGWSGFFGKFIEKATSRLAGRSIAVSEGTATGLDSLGVRKERIVVLPNGISTAVISAAPPGGEAADVIFAGRLIRDKHVDVLLRACADASRKMPLSVPLSIPLSVLIIGDGPERAQLEALAAELPLKVKFAGAVDETALYSSLKSSRVFVLPSTREGFSITTLEALACGLPVITVNGEKNSAKELVVDGVTGRVVGLDEKELSEAVLDVLGDEARRKRMAAECAPAAQKYDWDGLSRQLLECYAK
jgi:glycosyltransferase involved in cell wall biosynthesis